MVDDAHSGFTNEYRVAFLAQISDLAKARLFAAGLALRTLFSPAGAAGGVAGGVQLPAGIALATGIGINAPRVAQLPAGLALATKVNPAGVVKADLPCGLALSMGVTSSGGGGGGPITPGTTCGTAALVTLPFTQTQAIAAGGQAWWKFAGTSGTQYHLRITVVSGGAPSGHLSYGTCGSQSILGTVTPPGTPCASGVLPFTGSVTIDILGDFFSGCTVTVEVATGGC